MNINMQDALDRGYTFSWYQREEVPAPRTWCDRILRRHPTMHVWNRRVVVLHVEKLKVERFGGWPAIFDAFLLPMIPGGADAAVPWGPQIESDGALPESIPCAEQPRNPPECYTQRHADRGDGKGPA